MESSQNDNEFKALPHDPFEGMEKLTDSDLVSPDPQEELDLSPSLESSVEQEGIRQEMEPSDFTPPDFELEEAIFKANPAVDESPLAGDQGLVETKQTIDLNREPAPDTLSVEPDSTSTPEAMSLLEDLIESIDQEFDDLPSLEQETEPSFAQQPATLEEQFVVFTLSGTEYAVPIVNVTEIGYPLDVTPLPNVPEWVLGVANLRGDLISMIDLRTFFGLERATLGGSTRMLVGRTSNEDLNVGLIVDDAQGIRHLPVELIDRPTAEIESQIAPYLYGAFEEGEHLLVLLDLDRVLNSPKLRQFGPR